MAITLDQLQAAMAPLWIMWPHRATSATAVQALHAVYLTALADLTPAELTTAVQTAIQTGRHFPVPAELRDYARPQLSPGELEMQARYAIDARYLAQRDQEIAGLLAEPADAQERRAARAAEIREGIRAMLAGYRREKRRSLLTVDNDDE